MLFENTQFFKWMFPKKFFFVNLRFGNFESLYKCRNVFIVLTFGVKTFVCDYKDALEQIFTKIFNGVISTGARKSSRNFVDFDYRKENCIFANTE